MEARAEAGEQRPDDELGLGIQNAELNQMFAEDDLARAMLNGGATAPLPLPSASPGQHAGSSSIGSKDDQFAAYPKGKEEAEANVRRRIRDGTYKTEMCPSGQHCPLRRGRSCAFAHSVEELQERVRTARCVRSLLTKPVCLHSTYSTPSQTHALCLTPSQSFCAVYAGTRQCFARTSRQGAAAGMARGATLLTEVTSCHQRGQPPNSRPLNSSTPSGLAPSALNPRNGSFSAYDVSTWHEQAMQEMESRLPPLDCYVQCAQTDPSLISARVNYLDLAMTRRCEEWLQIRAILREEYNDPNLLCFET